MAPAVSFMISMRIWVKPDQLAKLGLTVPDITQALREQNVITPAGKVGGEPALPPLVDAECAAPPETGGGVARGANKTASCR